MSDHEQLRLFHALASTLHFGRTARDCHVSPSALSRSVQRLEAEVGAVLFVRDRHRVSLTPAGDVLRRHAEEALAGWDAVRRDLQTSGATLSGTLRVYCTVTAAQSLLPAVLATFRRSHPEIHLALRTGDAADAIDRLVAGEVDAAVAALPNRLPAALVTQEVATTSVVFVAPAEPGPVHDAAARRRIDWSAMPVVLPSRGLVRSRADRWFRARGVVPEIHAEVDGHEAVLALVALGCGVGVVPSLVIESSSLRGTVRRIDVRPEIPALHIGMCTRRRSLADPLVGALWASVASGR